MFSFFKKILNGQVADGNGERRTKNRYARVIRVALHADSGAVYQGKTENISMNSLFFICNEHCPLPLGSRGEVVLDGRGIPCSIARIDRNGGLALVIDNHESVMKRYIEPRKAASCCDCGSREDLLFCPMCRGMRTICRNCLRRNQSCMQCRAESLKYRSRSL